MENEIKQIKEDKNILLKRIKDLEDLVNVQNNEIKKLRNIEIEQKNIIEKINNKETFINEHRYKIGKINNIEKILNKQKSEIEKIKNWKNAYNTDMQEMLTIKMNKMTLNKIDSKIINKIEELEFLENRLKNDDILKKKNIIYKLLYRATKDGNNIKTFHNKCDNIKGTLIIIKTTKGMRFGGYTEQIWNINNNNNKCESRKDDKNICFCFSLDLFKIYNFNDNCQLSIHICYTSRLRFTGDYGQFIDIYNENGLLFGNTSYTIKSNAFGKIDKDYEINNGQKEFSVIEMEVFQIIFDI